VTTVGLRPPFVTPAAAYSHPDCRWILILIVAPHPIAIELLHWRVLRKYHGSITDPVSLHGSSGPT
jgi:hypothetical protein